MHTINIQMTRKGRYEGELTSPTSMTMRVSHASGARRGGRGGIDVGRSMRLLCVSFLCGSNG